MVITWKGVFPCPRISVFLDARNSLAVLFSQSMFFLLTGELLGILRGSTVICKSFHLFLNVNKLLCLLIAVKFQVPGPRFVFAIVWRKYGPVPTWQHTLHATCTINLCWHILATISSACS